MSISFKGHPNHNEVLKTIKIVLFRHEIKCDQFLEQGNIQIFANYLRKKSVSPSIFMTSNKSTNLYILISCTYCGIQIKVMRRQT